MNLKKFKLFCRHSVLNQINEHIMIYPIESGCVFQKMDAVVLNKNTCQVSHPKQSSDYIWVGCAVKTVTNESGTKMLICKDGIFGFNNSLDPEYTITSADIGEFCFFDSPDFVSMNSNNSTIAGRVLSVADGKVIVKNDIFERGRIW